MTSKKGWLMLLAGAVCALSLQVQAAFKCDVYVGSSEGVSLTFGVGDETKPFPPFSAMFGVKDVFLANPANYNTAAADVEGDMSRLGTALTAAGPWVIVANSNASLRFQMTDAAKVYVAYVDPKTEANTTAEVANGETLSVKAGVQYTVSLSQGEPADVSEDKMSQNVAIKKNEDKAYVAEKDFTDLTPGATYTLYFATDGSIGQRDGESWQIGLENALNEEWAADKSSVSFTADSATVTVTMEGSGSAKPLTATLVDSEDEKLAAINAILQKFGTLDFDQNGEVEINDIMYLYNFAVVWGCEPMAASDLAAGLDNVSEEQLNTALETLQGDTDSLDYDEDSEIDINDVMFLYNYAVVWGGDVSSADDLKAGLEGTPDVEKALENLADQNE